MLLSEAMFLGSTMKPQAFNRFYYEGATCAMGAALDAVGKLDIEVSYANHSTAADLWPWARTNDPAKAICPECGRHGLSHWDIITSHLNNGHGWTRERIADYVATVEPKEEIPVALEAQAEVAQ